MQTYDKQLMTLFYKTELHKIANAEEQLIHETNPLDKLIIKIRINKIRETIEEIEDFFNTNKIKLKRKLKVIHN